MARIPVGLFLLALIALPAAAQDDTAARNQSYDRCLTAIKEAPQDATEPCKAYVQAYPFDEARRRQTVQRWLVTYDKVQPYIQYLRGLSPADPEVSWFVYEPDLDIKLPQTLSMTDPYKAEISRSFNGRKEEALLRRAEAVYSSPQAMIEQVLHNLNHYAQDPAPEMAPIWGIRGNDNIQQANIVTARAVRYYYDLVQEAKQGSHPSSGLAAQHLILKYTASIKHMDTYSHKGETFTNVYVADLTLEWSFICGGLCGMGFTRNKVVVLDGDGNVLAMYLDSPVNSQSWVS